MAGKSLRLVAYAAIGVVFLAPFTWQVLASLRPNSEIFASVSPLSWNTFIPEKWTLENYADIFGLSPSGQAFNLNFGLNLANSSLVAAVVVLGNLVFNTMAAYFFSRSRFPGKNIVFTGIIAILLVPWQATMVPLFLVVNAMGMENSFAALTLPWLANPLGIFFLRVMFDRVPRELDEAAMIDGASRFTILMRILLPNSIPALITMGLLELQSIWNQFFWPLVAVSDSNLQLIQVALAAQTTEATTYWGRALAGSVITCLPVIVFLLLQKYYTKGVAFSGLKG
jgi:ABC-type glycerol-3-phosphate transport system permease component